MLHRLGLFMWHTPCGIRHVAYTPCGIRHVAYAMWHIRHVAYAMWHIRHVAYAMWHTPCGIRLVAYAMWHTPCDIRQMLSLNVWFHWFLFVVEAHLSRPSIVILDHQNYHNIIWTAWRIVADRPGPSGVVDRFSDSLHHRQQSVESVWISLLEGTHPADPRGSQPQQHPDHRRRSLHGFCKCIYRYM